MYDSQNFFFSVQSTSASSRGTSSRHPTLPPPITATSSASQSTPGTPPHSSTDVSSPNATKSVTVKRGSSHKNLQSDKTTKLGKSHSAVFHSSDYRAPRRAIPSPPGSFSYRSSSGNGSVRGSPYHSPRDSPRNGSLRGSARNSPKGGSPRTSAHNSPRSSVSNSPSPPPSLITAVSYTSGGSAPSSPQELVPRRSKPNSPKQESPRSGPTTPLTRRSPVDTNEGHPTSAGSQTPPLNLDFESGQVVSQLPFEYSSFLDLPPSALGKWIIDRKEEGLETEVPSKYYPCISAVLQAANNSCELFMLAFHVKRKQNNSRKSSSAAKHQLSSRPFGTQHTT